MNVIEVYSSFEMKILKKLCENVNENFDIDKILVLKIGKNSTGMYHDYKNGVKMVKINTDKGTFF